ncbi:MAG TPA: hypothetical protein VHV74_19040 [Pseudonocardiaceae bacterium]|nr:hypothetical protein [Pseudonocardiaceae bacterium]
MDPPIIPVRLCAESDTSLPDAAWTIQAPSLPQGTHGTSDTTVDLVIRSGLEIPLAREASWRPFSEQVVEAVTTALVPSLLTRAMSKIALEGLSDGGVDTFGFHGLNRSHAVTFTLSCAPGGSWPLGSPKPVEASVRLTVPGSYGQLDQNLRVEIDVVVRHSVLPETEQPTTEQPTTEEQPVWRITTQQLGDLIDAVLAILSSENVVVPLAELAGVDASAVPQPDVLHPPTSHPGPTTPMTVSGPSGHRMVRSEDRRSPLAYPCESRGPDLRRSSLVAPVGGLP